MKTWKLVSGILSIIMFLLVVFQSCAAGISNTMEGNGEVGGSVGIFVAVLLLSGGIISVATRNGGKGGNVALIVIFGLAAIMGFTGAGSYTDLMIWSCWCMVCVVMAIVALVKSKPKSKEK